MRRGEILSGMSAAEVGLFFKKRPNVKYRKAEDCGFEEVEGVCILTIYEMSLVRQKMCIINYVYEKRWLY